VESSLLADLSPQSIASSGAISVRPTLQIKDTEFDNIYAIGDAVNFQRSLKSPSAMLQGRVAAYNIVAAISGHSMQTYTPEWWESTIELTLGIVSISTTILSHASCD
jgi:apoptosis-inducing factor 2